MRRQFHYDWHWQSPYGNGDLGNQGPHQLDICRWAIGDPMAMPAFAIAIGGRLAHDDNGDTPNTQIAYYDFKPAPILFEVRGLPKAGVDYKKGMDKYKGVGIGNLIEYEGGYLTGGHGGNCAAYDNDGKKIKQFKGGGNAFNNFFDAVLGRKKQTVALAAESAHYSCALAHLGNHSIAAGAKNDGSNIATAISKNKLLAESYQRLGQHLEANGVDEKTVVLGAPIGMDQDEKFTTSLAQKFTALDQGEYREEFRLPT